MKLRRLVVGVLAVLMIGNPILSVAAQDSSLILEGPREYKKGKIDNSKELEKDLARMTSYQRPYDLALLDKKEALIVAGDSVNSRTNLNGKEQDYPNSECKKYYLYGGAIVGGLAAGLIVKGTVSQEILPYVGMPVILGGAFLGCLGGIFVSWFQCK